MELSRVEAKKELDRRRRSRLKRRMILNLMLLGIIVVLAAVLIQVWHDDLTKSWNSLPFVSKSSEMGTVQQSVDSQDGGAAIIDDDTPDEGAVKEEDSVQTDDGDHAGEPVASASPASAEGQTVLLSFVGDILLGPYVEKVIPEGNYHYLFDETTNYLSKADLTAGNLEAPITTIDNPFPKKDYVYKASPKSLPALKASGVDIVSLGNNHTLDHGVEGMRDTIKYLDENGIWHMGVGENDTEAFAPLYAEANGITVAYIGVSRVIFSQSMKADKYVPGVAETYDPARAIKAIEEAKEQADLVVVMPHWGTMNTTVLNKEQMNLAKAYIDAGADLVIGSHPHVLQGFETYKGKWIAYSLGNFIFGIDPKGEERETAVLDAVCTKKGDCQLRVHPMFVKGGQPKPMEEEEGQGLLNRLMAISPGLRFEKDGSIRAE